MLNVATQMFEPVGLAPGLRYGRPFANCSVPGGVKRFFTAPKVQSFYRIHPVSYLNDTVDTLSWVRRPDCEVPCLFTVSMLRMSGALPPLPLLTSWSAQGKFFLYYVSVNTIII
jgi:hypothetical protein